MRFTPPPRVHQVPAASQLLAVQLKLQMALRVSRARISFGLPGAAIPKHDGTAAVGALGDRPFEAAVLDRVILGLYREPFHPGVQ